jgi:hypothetical protein
MVYRLLGWDASAFGGRICADTLHPSELAAGEFVPFVLPSGLVLPVFEREMCPCAISKYFGD